MTRRRRERELVGPWRKLHLALWLVGLAILIWQGWIWPGVLVLLALSALLEVILLKVAPQAFEDEPAAAQPAAPAVAPAAPQHRFELLPTNCPKCGAPVRGEEVKWTGAQSADCLYCSANLPMIRPGQAAA